MSPGYTPPMPTLTGPAITALSSSELQKELAGLNQRLIELEAKLDHVLNNQHAVAEATTRQVHANLDILLGSIDYVCSQVSSGEHVMSGRLPPPREVMRRVGDRLVSRLDYYLPGEVALGSITNDGTVWALTDDNSVLRWDRAGAGWTMMPGKLRWLSTPTAEQVWGVSPAGQVFRWLNGGWQLIDGNLATIAAAADGTVVGTAPDDTIWRRYPNTPWHQLPGRLRRIAILSQNELLGVSANDQIWRWNGSDWTRLDGLACEVAIGPGPSPVLYCVNRGGQAYERHHDRWSTITGGGRLVFAGQFRLDQFGHRLMVQER